MSTTLPAPPEPELEAVLQDIASRFLPCLPPKELEGVRIFFQLREMFWFYQDFLAQNKKLPKLKFANFCKLCVEHVEALAEIFRGQDFDQRMFSYSQYLQNVPSCGVILVNRPRTKVVLVRGFTFKRSWSFPKGKVNEGEPELDCAIRECREEVGLDLSPRLMELGWQPGSKAASPFPVIRSERYGKRMSMYIIPDVPEDTKFVTNTIGEVSDIKWFKISALPRSYKAEQDGLQGEDPKAPRFWAVGDFMPSLHKWMGGKLGAENSVANSNSSRKSKEKPVPSAAPSPPATPSRQASGRNSKKAASGDRRSGSNASPPKIHTRDHVQQQLFQQLHSYNHYLQTQDLALAFAGVEELAVPVKPQAAFSGLDMVYQPQMQQLQAQSKADLRQLEHSLGYVDSEVEFYTSILREIEQQQQQPPPQQQQMQRQRSKDSARGPPVVAQRQRSDPENRVYAGFVPAGSTAAVEGEASETEDLEFPEDGAFSNQQQQPRVQADPVRHSQAAWDSRNQSTFGQNVAASSFSPQQMLSVHDRSLSRIENVPSSSSGRYPKAGSHGGGGGGGRPRDEDTFGAVLSAPGAQPSPAPAKQAKPPKQKAKKQPQQQQQQQQPQPLGPNSKLKANRNGGRPAGKPRDSETFGHMM